jgi:hypothetical protein
MRCGDQGEVLHCGRAVIETEAAFHVVGGASTQGVLPTEMWAVHLASRDKFW